MWIATLSPGLIRFDPETGEQQIIYQEAEIRSLARDRDGTIWFSAINKGLGRILPDSVTPNVASTEYPISSLAPGSDGGLWLGTWGGGIGIMETGSGEIRYIQSDPGDANGLSNDFISTVIEDSAGMVWIGTYESGLDGYDRDNGKFIHYRHDPGDGHSLVNDTVLSLYEDRSGVLWVGSGVGGGISMKKKGSESFHHYRPSPGNPDYLAGRVVSGIHEDETGRVWIATLAGLERWNRPDGTWTHYRHDPLNPKSLSSDSVRSVFIDSSGTPWIGTDGGFDRYDEQLGVFVHYEVPTVMWTCESTTGRLWLATKGGFFSFDRSSGEAALLRKGISWKIMVLEDSEGTVWVGSSGDGLERYRPNGEEWRRYANDGLQSAIFWRNSYHRNADGELYFGGDNGFNVFYPGSIVENRYSPPVEITAVRIFNKPTDLVEGVNLVLSHGSNYLSFDFASLDYNNPMRNQYAYIMEGLDDDWVYSGNRRHADYPDLKPGSYVFRVRGSNSAGVWGENEANLRIEITPPFWGTWWFRATGVAVLLVLLYLMYRYRLGRNLEKEKAVHEERNRLARELHDAVTQNLFSASLMTEVLPDLYDADPDEGKAQLAEIHRLTSGALAEMRGLLIELRPERLISSSMNELLDQLGRAFTGKTGVKVFIDTTLDDSLPEKKKHALYRITQEALNNAAKHAQSSKVEIKLRREEGEMVLAIEDNGVGFDTQNTEAGHFSLEIMAERAADAGARFDVVSAPGAGTKILVRWQTGEAANGR